MTAKTIYAALDAARQKFPPVVKGHTADTGKYQYRYADLKTVLDAVEPCLRDENLMIVQHVVQRRVSKIDPSGQGMESASYLNTIVTWIDGAAGDALYCDIPLPTDVTPQAFGGAITYARRYGVVTLLGLVTEEDDDGSAASGVDADTRPSAEGQRVRRTRRTKEQMAADKAAAAETAKDADKQAEPVVPDATDPAQVADPETETPPAPPEGWDTTANAVASHNLLAKRIVALPADFRQPAMDYRKEHGWPLPLVKFNELEEVVSVAEGFRPESS